jgi:hypothetical protein
MMRAASECLVVLLASDGVGALLGRRAKAPQEARS